MGRGGRTSACSTTGFSSMQTTGSFSERGFSYSASTSSMRAMYSSSISAIHQLFFPPRLQIMALQQDTDGFPAHRRRQLPLCRFLGYQPYAPSRPALRRRAAHHGDDPLALARVQNALFARTWPLIQCRVQSFILITPGDGTHRLWGYPCVFGHLRHPLPNVELAQNRSSPQHTRRLLTLPQHLGHLPPILPCQLNMHAVVALHVPTMKAHASRGKYPQRYIFILSQTLVYPAVNLIIYGAGCVRG